MELSLVPGASLVHQQKVSNVAVSVGLWRVLQSPLSRPPSISLSLGRLKDPDRALAGARVLRAAHCRALPGMLCQRLLVYFCFSPSIRGHFLGWRCFP